tara:strand:- start:253 stop:492 length:240 start_codon:yes stop_codon:yes gene_type:complete
MAGVKKSTGHKVHHSKYYKNGQEWKPAKVIGPKMFSKGYKEYMAAQSVQTGELYRNHYGRVAPWHSIQFTSIKPQELDD